MEQQVLDLGDAAAVSLLHDDAAKALSQLDNGEAALIVTSPPYNIGKEYERDRKLSLPEYIEWLKPIAAECYRVLADSGSLCWQTGNYIEDGVLHPLDYHIYMMFTAFGMKLGTGSYGGLTLVFMLKSGFRADMKHCYGSRSLTIILLISTRCEFRSCIRAKGIQLPRESTEPESLAETRKERIHRTSGNSLRQMLF